MKIYGDASRVNDLEDHTFNMKHIMEDFVKSPVLTEDDPNAFLIVTAWIAYLETVRENWATLERIEPSAWNDAVAMIKPLAEIINYDITGITNFDTSRRNA